MDTTLKRAADLARAALDAANAIDLAPKVSISIHMPAPAMAAQDALRAFDEGLARFEALLAAHYAIRALIGAANAQSGLDGLLTRRAHLDALERRLTEIAEKAGAARDSHQSLTMLDAGLASARQRIEGGHGYPHDEKVMHPLVDTVRAEALADRRAALRRERADIADAVAGINLNRRIAIDAAAVETLKEAKILA